jgi:nitrite reductase/ring-hydroxylating ferredoxin subunit
METEETSALWKRAAGTGEVANDDVIAVSVGEKRIALYKVAGQFYATDDICTHEYAHLSEGYLDQWEIECPLHQARFDIRTGKAVCRPATCDLATYPVRVEGNEVQVKLGK